MWRDREMPMQRVRHFGAKFGDLLVFVYHCFDRIVIRGYLTALSRPELELCTKLGDDGLRRAAYRDW